MPDPGDIFGEDMDRRVKPGETAVGTAKIAQMRERLCELQQVVDTVKQTTTTTTDGCCPHCRPIYRCPHCGREVPRWPQIPTPEPRWCPPPPQQHWRGMPPGTILCYAPGVH